MTTTFVYIACAGGGGAVDAFALDPESGTLEPLTRVEVGGRVSALALDPAGILYAGVNGTPNRTVALSLDPATGAASPAGERDVPVTTCFLSLAGDGSGGQSLYSASYHEGVTVGYTAPLEPGAPVTEYSSGPNSHCAVPSPDGAYVYAASLGADRISWFAAPPTTGRGEAATGGGQPAVVRPVGTVDAAPGSGPRFLRHTEDGRRAYVVHERTGTVDVYSRDADSGALELLQRISAVEGLGLAPGPVRGPDTPDPGPHVVWCADVRLTPDERFLYATERSTSTIACFAVGKDGGQEEGRLTFVRRTETEAQPRIIAVDPSGRWLLACGERSDHVTVYAIGPDGELDPAFRAATAAGPLWIEFWRPMQA